MALKGSAVGIIRIHSYPHCNEKIVDLGWTPEYGFLITNSTAKLGYQSLDE